MRPVHATVLVFVFMAAKLLSSAEILLSFDIKAIYHADFF